ncbi:MAG: hypothetical protein AAFP86_03455 [Planctomycetota bacterium]
MLRSALLLATLAPAVSAQTVWFVDDDAGSAADFNDLQSAVDAASPGDRIEVLPGNYPDFAVISKGITVMAETPGTALMGSLSVTGLPAGELLVLTDLTYGPSGGITLLSCPGTVLVDGGTARFSTFGCEDVRIKDVWSSSLTLRDSFVQVTDANGTVGPIFAESSTVILSNVASRGISGTVQSTFGCSAIDGEPALECGDSDVWLLDCSFIGGDGALGPDISCDALPGSGIRAVDSTVHIARTQVESGFFPIGTFTPPPISTFQSQVLQDETLAAMQLRGGNRVGETAEFATLAGPFTVGRLWAGRTPLRAPFGDSIDVLHSYERGVSLGFISLSGQNVIPFTIPALPRGTVIHAQARRTTKVRSDNSNAVALIVR